MSATRRGGAVVRLAGLVFVGLLLAGSAFAGFAGTDLFIPNVGRQAGIYPSSWFTTVWIHNPSGGTVSVSIYFLERNKNNTTAVPVVESIAAGETKMYENIVETMFGKLAYGALRITCDEKVVATARTYQKDPSAPVSQSFGQDVAATPPSFAIGLSETTEILGGYQTVPVATSEQRYNIGAVEVTGASATIRWTARDANGVELAHYDKPVLPLGQVQGAFKDYFPGQSSTNSRITAEVISGSGKVIAYGTSITNQALDPTTFEMTYPDDVLYTPHLTGLFHGAVWSTDGLVVEGGLELEISTDGLVSYSGAAGLECGADLYTLDIADTPASPIALDGSGNFTAAVTIAYEDGGSTVFTTTWTLNGNRDADGILTGTLRSDTTGGAGDWAACNGTNVVRNWRAGWTDNPA